MDIILGSFAFLVAALCVGVMGFAIQRGATCTVAAVDEVVGKGSFRRLVSLVEAAVWVAGGLLVAQALHLLPKMPAGYPLTAWTVLGGVLLGLGAFINQACVFGAIALFGSGRWAQLFMPIGFYLGCVSLKYVFALPDHRPQPYGSPVLQAPIWAAALFLLFVAWRLAWPLFVAAAEELYKNVPADYQRELETGAKVGKIDRGTLLVGKTDGAVTYVKVKAEPGIFAVSSKDLEDLRKARTDIPA